MRKSEILEGWLRHFSVACAGREEASCDLDLLNVLNEKRP